MLTAAGAAARPYSGPYPSWPAPTAGACRQVAERLAAVHGWPSAGRAAAPQVGCEERSSVLDSLVRTLLSQNTTDITSGRAFKQLKQRFPSWEAVRLAEAADVADAIRVGGLADIKAARIQAILHTLAAERGACCLEHLRALPPDEAAAQLRRFKGCGPKTISCVMLFALQASCAAGGRLPGGACVLAWCGRRRRAVSAPLPHLPPFPPCSPALSLRSRPSQLDDFPVDTHVWEISKALGWAPTNATRDQAYEHLNCLVPGAPRCTAGLPPARN